MSDSGNAGSPTDRKITPNPLLEEGGVTPFLRFRILFTPMVFGVVALLLSFTFPLAAVSANHPSIRSIEQALASRQKEMRSLRARLARNKKKLKAYRGKRLELKVKILKLRVRMEEFHVKVENLHIKEIRDRRAIKRLDQAIAHLDEVIQADLVQKDSLDSRLLKHRAEMALSQMDGSDISPDIALRTYVISGQTHKLTHLVTQYRSRKTRLQESQVELKKIKDHEEKLLRSREAEEIRLRGNMKSTQEEIARLRKMEKSIHEDDRSILLRRRKLMALISRLERKRRLEHRHEVYRNPPVPGHSTFLWPVEGKVVETYGPFHDGIDIAARIGSRVHAAWSGKVLFARVYSGYGHLVILEHGNHLYTLYGHLDRIYAHEGQHVQAGGILGTIGRGGTRGQSTLFFGVTRHGKPLSPMGFLKR